MTRTSRYVWFWQSEFYRPTIYSVVSDQARVGDPVTIFGNHLTRRKGTPVVTIGAVRARVVAASKKEVIVRVPPTAGPFPLRPLDVTVTAKGYSQVSYYILQVVHDAAILTSVRPRKAVSGRPLLLRGVHLFAADDLADDGKAIDPDAVTIEIETLDGWFICSPAPGSVASDTEITVVVPPGLAPTRSASLRLTRTGLTAQLPDAVDIA